MQSQRFDVSGATSAAEAAAMVSSGLSSGEAAYGNLFVAVGFRDGLWPDKPTAELLDAATGDTPVVVISGDLHAVWLNSAGGARFGHGAGLLREQPAFEVTNAVGQLDDATLDALALTAGKRAAARGVVGFADLEMEWNSGTWVRRMANGFDTQRVEAAIYTQHLGRAIAEGLSTGQSITDLLTVGRYKVLTDGSLNTRTAWCVDPYPGTSDRGLLEVDRETLQANMRRAIAAGIEPTLHAIGDAAVTFALDAFESLGVGGWIEHAQLVATADLPRFAALGVTASVQPEHAMDDRDVADAYWAGRTERVIPVRGLLDAGARVVFGSDAPVAPLDPWVTIAAAVGRSRDGREPWEAEQRVTNAEALAASVRSTVAVGQPADLVITELDPLGCSHEELRTMPVYATLLQGRVTHLEDQ
jgi:predicted amidohydrolase YtcJ